MILISGYSVELRAKVIDRWLELEKASMPKTLPEALRAYANEVEAKEKAEATSRRLLHDSGTFTTTEIAKELGMSSAIALNEKLRDGGFIYKDPRGRWLLTANYSEFGYQNLKQKEANGIIIYYAEWTNKGRDWLLQIFGGSNDL
jgi:phage antirepressor YoqD-like protein